MFYTDFERDLAVALIPKAGCQSIREWLGRSFQVIPNEDVTVSRRVAFVRNPLERLKSCFSMMYWATDYGSPHPCGAPVDSYESFIDFIFENDNEHWKPQSSFFFGTANIIHRFENFELHWENYRPGYFPHNNRSSRRPTTDYRMDEIKAMYAQDMDIWSNAT